jgi:hypothetical protein
MKRILISLFFLIGALSLFSQAPEGFSYQAVVRDNGGFPVANQAVSFRFTIIQGTPAGASVFEETHNLTTDDFGVVSLVINNGTGKVGTFETINWGSDSYFLKVEIDKTGGTSYSDMGTTQLLSVPYALYAKASANGFSGNYNDLVNRPVTDGSETKISAGNNMTVTGSGTLSDPYIVTNGSGGSSDSSGTNISVGNNLTISGSGTKDDPYIINERTHTVGESYGGGIVFYVYDNGRHGLIAASSDQDPEIQWYNGSKRYTNTTGDGIGAGIMNTMLIIALQTNDNPMSTFAAKVCADYSVTANGVSYGDWYLPSKFELTLLFTRKDYVGDFTSEYYWSSTEFSSISAWCQNFSTGSQYNLSKSIPYGVRAIRAF